MPFTPLQNYAGYNHVLGASACFVHPGNGNIYFCACEQHAGTQQDLSVYRMLSTTGAIELVKRYRGTVDSPSQVTMGGCVIGQGGALIVATSLVIKDAAKVTGTGWQGSWIREPGVDAPWSLSPTTTADPRLDALVSQLAALSHQITEIETALGNLQTGGGLSAEDVEALRWITAYRAVLHEA